MAETKTIGRISVVTDSETSYDNIGDIDGGFDEQALRQHIQHHGAAGVLEKLGWMSWQVCQLVREGNQEKALAEYCNVAPAKPE